MRQISSEDSLIREASRARKKATDLEREPESWPVTVTCWIHAFPSGADGHNSPFDILADHWTAPAPQAPLDGRTGGDQAQAIWTLQQNAAALQRQVLELNREVTQYRAAREEDHQTITQLQAEREAGRGRREESAQTAATLRRLEGEIATLNRAFETQGAEMQELRQECERLDRENRKLDREKRTATKDTITLQTALTRVERERNEARKELDQVKATLRGPSSYRWKGTKSRSDRLSGSSSSSRTYVDQSDSLNRGTSRSGSSRESSRDSRRGSFRDDREDGARDGRRETPRDERRESSRDGRRGSFRDDRTQSSSDRRESVRGDGREDPRYGRNERSRYIGEDHPSESRGGTSRDSREDYTAGSRGGSSRDSREENPAGSRGGSSRDGRVNYPPSREEEDVRYNRRPAGDGSQRRRWL